MDGDGQVEIIPNAGKNIIVYRLIRGPDGKGTAKFDKHVIKEGGCGHGFGFGDVNGDGRGDFIVPDGDDSLWAIHTEMVEKAQANRARLIEIAVSAATSIVNILE